jgi:predicted DNA-binding protein (MmcQ/YjbR family)
VSSASPRLASSSGSPTPPSAPGTHLNKRHWNTVTLDGSLIDHFIRDLVEDSYDLVVSALPTRMRNVLESAPEASASRR